MLKHRTKIYFKSVIRKIAFVFSDIMLLLLSFLIAYQIRDWAYGAGMLDIPNPPVWYFYSYWYLLLFHVLFLFVFDLYRLRFPFFLEYKKTLKAVAAGTVSIFFVLALLKISQEVSRFIILFIGIVAGLTIPILRLLVKYILFRMNLWQADALIIGNPDADFHSFCNTLGRNWYVGYRPAHVIDVTKMNQASHPEVLSIERLEHLIREHNIVVPILYKLDKNEFYDIFIKMDIYFEDIKLIPDLHSLFVNNLSIESDGSNILINFENNLLRYNNQLLQYLFNKVASIIIFVLLLPVFLILGLLIKLDSPGPILYKARRIGADNIDFDVYKFRTMFRDADKKLHDLLDSDPALREEFERNFKLKDDPRITRIGRFLRRTSLDELPQIFNVLRGEMNLVGPRPIVREEIEKYGDAFDELMKVKPGATGLWQVSGRNDIDYEKRVQLDLFYIKNWSLWMDITILMKTLLVVLRRRGAY